MGRTGKFFAYELYGVAPDILASAKGIGGGFPLGAVLSTAEASKGMGLGTHGTTYGGNPLAMACGNAVLDILLAPGFLDDVARKGLLLRQSLSGLAAEHPDVVAEIRGEGLMQGLRLRVPNADFASAARAEKLVVIPAADNVVRIIPPLIVSEDEIREGVRRLGAACGHFEVAATQKGKLGANS
jgi:acetylornithine/N-succinyldiaminopimelate aminotransferase